MQVDMVSPTMVGILFMIVGGWKLDDLTHHILTKNSLFESNIIKSRKQLRSNITIQ